MSAERKPVLVIVAGSFDHTKDAKEFYPQVEDAFSDYFEPYTFFPYWIDRKPGIEAANSLLLELGEKVDEVVKEQEAKGGISLDKVRRPALLGLSVGGDVVFSALSRHPDKYHRGYAVSARLGEEGIEDLRGINPAGATMVEVFLAGLPELNKSSVRTGSPVNGDERVSLTTAQIVGVAHDRFQVSGRHIQGIKEITTTPARVRTIAQFLRAA